MARYGRTYSRVAPSETGHAFGGGRVAGELARPKRVGIGIFRVTAPIGLQVRAIAQRRTQIAPRRCRRAAALGTASSRTSIRRGATSVATRTRSARSGSARAGGSSSSSRRRRPAKKAHRCARSGASTLVEKDRLPVDARRADVLDVRPHSNPIAHECGGKYSNLDAHPRRPRIRTLRKRFRTETEVGKELHLRVLRKT